MGTQTTAKKKASEIFITDKAPRIVPKKNSAMHFNKAGFTPVASPFFWAFLNK